MQRAGLPARGGLDKFGRVVPSYWGLPHVNLPRATHKQDIQVGRGYHAIGEAIEVVTIILVGTSAVVAAAANIAQPFFSGTYRNNIHVPCSIYVLFYEVIQSKFLQLTLHKQR
jgi:hypothetical protein